MRNFGIVMLVILLLVVFVGLPIFFTATPAGVTMWNNWFHKVQEADDDTNYETLKKDAKSKEVEKELLSEIELSYSNGITATPTIVINDIKYMGSMGYSQLLTRVKQAHKREKNNKN